MPPKPAVLNSEGAQTRLKPVVPCAQSRIGRPAFGAGPGGRIT